MNVRIFALSMLTSTYAMAGMETLFNPMLLSSPAANPLIMAAPLGAAAITPGLLGAPLGGYGSPLGMVAPVAGMGVMHPAMQVAPNWMSFQHQAPQLMTNPYMGGPLSQLPIGQSAGALPFVPAGYGVLPYALPAPAVTGLPFSGGWGGATAMPAIPLNPYLMPAAPPAQAQGALLPFNPLDLFRTPAPPAPQPSIPAGLPFASPWAAAQPAVSTAASAPAPAKATQAPPPLSVPFTSPWAQTPPPSQAPAVVAATKDAPKAAPPSTPFDPAYWLAPLKVVPAPAAK